MKVVSEATTTAAKEVKATVSLTAAFLAGLKVSIEKTSPTEDLYNDGPEKLMH